MTANKNKSQPLKNQVALITGATGGIGQALSEQLARNGANLILTARNAQTLEEKAGEHGSPQ